LQRGTTTYCNKNFTVENMGKEMVEVHIIRGNSDNYDKDQIPSGGKLGYKLQDRSVFATSADQTLQLSRIVQFLCVIVVLGIATASGAGGR